MHRRQFIVRQYNQFLLLITLLVYIIVGIYTTNNHQTAAINIPIDNRELKISFSKGQIGDSKYRVARIKLESIEQLKTELSSGFYDEKTEKTSTLANRVKAIFAINGDYYRFKGDGFVCRNGHVYRNDCNESRDVLIIDNNGWFHILRHAKHEEIESYIENAWQGFTFGPGLIVDGALQTDFVDNDNSAFSPAGRMCIAQIGELEYLCIAVDGPESGTSKGMTIQELAEFVSNIDGVKNAYNLDGGFSVNMVYHGEKINEPEKERPVCDIIYFVGAEKQQ